MKKSLTLSIPKPCSENWDNFSPASNGGFCSSCSKVVVDFTNMSDEEVIDFFTSKADHTCGRFRPGQLKEYSHIAPLKINPGFTLLKASFLSLLFVLVNRQAPAQDKIGEVKIETIQQPCYEEKNTSTQLSNMIKGVVRSAEDNEPLAGVNVYLKGSSIGTASDAVGEFQLSHEFKEGDVLVFAFIGLETQEYIVPKNAPPTIEISMKLTTDVHMLGAVAVDGAYLNNKPALLAPGFRKRLWSKVKSIF